jgi:hypothetical protein
VRPECCDHWDVSGVAATCNKNASDTGAITPCIEGEPATAQESFKPSVEIHGRRIRLNANVSQKAIAITSRNIEAAAERYRRMSEIATHAEAPFIASLAVRVSRANG